MEKSTGVRSECLFRNHTIHCSPRPLRFVSIFMDRNWPLKSVSCQSTFRTLSFLIGMKQFSMGDYWYWKEIHSLCESEREKVWRHENDLNYFCVTFWFQRWMACKLFILRMSCRFRTKTKLIPSVYFSHFRFQWNIRRHQNESSSSRLHGLGHLPARADEWIDRIAHRTEQHRTGRESGTWRDFRSVISFQCDAIA